VNNKDSGKNKDNRKNVIEKTSKSIAKVPNKKSTLDDLATFMALLKDTFKGKYKGLSVFSGLGFVAAIIYLLSVVDLIPDAILVLGIVDDAALIAFALKMIHKDVVKYRIWRDDCDKE